MIQANRHSKLSACQQPKEDPRGTHWNIRQVLKEEKNKGVDKIDHRRRTNVRGVRLFINDHLDRSTPSVKNRSVHKNKQPNIVVTFN